MSAQDLIVAYECGIDYGLLMAENERDSEDVFDAAGCAAFSARMCVPSIPAARRKPRGEAWRKAKRDAMSKFLELVVKVANEEETP